MPDFDVTGPDGKDYTITGPEGSTREQALLEAPKLYAQGKLRLKEQVEQRGVGERLGTGFMDPFYGAAQIGARMMDPGEEMAGLVSPLHQEEREKRIAQVDDIIKKREQDIQKRAGKGIDWWRLVGQAGNPMLYAPAFIGGLPGAAASGVMAAVTQPTTDTNHFATRKAQDAMMGGIFGTAGGVVTNVAGRAVSPIVGRVAQELMNRGVELTPGRLAGALMSRMEDAARSIPWLGQMVRNAEMRTTAGYNIAGINTALDRIGAVLPAGTRAGREAMASADTLFDQEYQRLLAHPGLSISIDPAFSQELAAINQFATNELPVQMQEQFRNILQSRLGTRFVQGQMTVDGRALQDMQSAFGEFSRRYQKSADPDQRRMGELFGDVRETILDTLERQAPREISSDFRNLREGYSMFIRLQQASARRAGAGAEEGMFRPMDLAAAVKQVDPTRRKSAYTRGHAILQEFAEWGQFLLPSRLPDSGTPERWLWGALLGGTAWGGHAIIPSLADPAFMSAAATTAAASTLYTRAGQRAVNVYAAPGPLRRAIRRRIEEATPAAGIPSSVLRFDAQGKRVEGQ